MLSEVLRPINVSPDTCRSRLTDVSLSEPMCVLPLMLTWKEPSSEGATVTHALALTTDAHTTAARSAARIARPAGKDARGCWVDLVAGQRLPPPTSPMWGVLLTR